MSVKGSSRDLLNVNTSVEFAVVSYNVPEASKSNQSHALVISAA